MANLALMQRITWRDTEGNIHSLEAEWHQDESGRWHGSEKKEDGEMYPFILLPFNADIMMVEEL